MKLYKRMQQRVALTVVAATIFASAGTPVFAADYDGHWAAESIQEWKDKGVIGGYEDGSFRPKQNVTRAELAAILVRVFGLTETTGAESFSDVKSSDWYANDIAKISAAGIMYTEGTSFKPNNAATREEAAYAVAKAYKITGSASKTFGDQSRISEWAEDEIDALVAGGYISGRPDGTFAPKDSLTRADMVTMIDKVTAQLYNKAGEYSEGVIGNVVINTKDVILKDMTISGNLYISEGVGDGDVTLENVIVKGEVFVEGGGLNSIKLNGNTSIKKVTVDKANGEVRLVTSGNTKVEQVLVESGVKLEGQFDQVSLMNKVAVEILANSSIGKLIVDKNAKDLTIKLASGVTVKEAILNSKATLTGSGKVTLVTLADGIKASDVSLKVSIGTMKDSTGKEVTSNITSSSSSSSSSNDSSSSVISSYRIKGQLTINNAAIDYGNSTYYGSVKLIPYVVVNGEEKLDTSKAITVKANNKGEFDFGKVAKGQKYGIYASYDLNGKRYKSETHIINQLNSNQFMTIDLIEIISTDESKDIIVHNVKVINENTIEVIMDKMGEVRAGVSTISGAYTTKWDMSDDKQVTTIILPEGKKLEANKEYELVLYQESYKDYTVSIKWEPESTTPGQVVVNKANLEAAIKNVENLKLDASKYTTESYKALQTALEVAKAVVEKEEVSQEDVTEATTNLIVALKGLQEVESTTPGQVVVNKANLEAAIKNVENLKLDASKYTTESYKALQTALEVAKAVVEKEEVSQEDVTEATTNLIVALKGLQEVESTTPGQVVVNKANLEAAIKNVENLKLDASKYTTESYKALQTALEVAKAVVEKEEVSQEDVTEATTNLIVALKGLQEVESTTPGQVVVNKANLEAAIKNVENLKLDASKYTTESYKALQTALEVAKAVVEKEEVGQEEVTEATTNLIVALKGLQEVESTTPGQVVVNKANLEAAIKNVENLKLDASKYTTESYKVLQVALEAAKAVVEKAEVGQEEVTEATTNLIAALKGLQEVESTAPGQVVVNKQNLEAAIKNVERLNLQAAEYTEKSYKALQSALEVAKAVIDKEEVSQEKVTEVTNSLITALKGLQK